MYHSILIYINWVRVQIARAPFGYLVFYKYLSLFSISKVMNETNNYYLLSHQSDFVTKSASLEWLIEFVRQQPNNNLIITLSFTLL